MMTAMLGGEVKAAEGGGEYGRMAMKLVEPDSSAFSYLPKDVSSVNVWMSHGDEAVRLPEGFKAVARSQQVRSNRSSSSTLMI
jgi:GMP synthase (glutamine-hydrolysing)